MDRKSFIKRLTAAAIGIVVAKPIIDALPKPVQRSYIHGTSKFVASIDPIGRQFNVIISKPWRQYPLTYEDVYRLDKEGKEVYMNANGEVIITPKPIIYDNDDSTTPS